MSEEAQPHRGGKLADNVVLFAQLLRRAGIPVGSGQVLDATRALAAVGVSRRDDVRHALYATLVSRHEQRLLFDQAFELFWRNPFARNEALAMLLPRSQMQAPRKPDTLRRLRDAWQPPATQPAAPPPQLQAEGDDEEAVLDAVMTFAPAEVSRSKDFEQMTAAELRAARQLIAQMDLSVRPLPARRFERAGRGRFIDMRRTLQASIRGGTDTIPLQHKRRRVRHPAIVAICDISGSMDRYSRMLLCFLHALTNARDRVHSFVFGTRLTNISRALAQRDIDAALAQLGSEVNDWSGGTRIGLCLRRFNHDWSRRVLAQGAVVLLITDGLDREPEIDLGFEADRLHRSCRRLIWLNPLLRYDGFEPLARGIVQLLPHVDEHRPVHNLNSLQQLAYALATGGSGEACRSVGG